VAIREWWQTTPRGDPHTFDLVLNLTGSDGEAATAEFVDQVIEAVRLVKPLRSHFTFTQGIRSEGDVGVLGRARVVRYERLQFNVSAGDNPEPDPVLLMEDGSALLLESGLGGLLLEDNP
jgi:P2-related tail formation protein